MCYSLYALVNTKLLVRVLTSLTFITFMAASWPVFVWRPYNDDHTVSSSSNWNQHQDTVIVNAPEQQASTCEDKSECNGKWLRFDDHNDDEYDCDNDNIKTIMMMMMMMTWHTIVIWLVQFLLGLDRYRYRVSADTRQYQWVSASVSPVVRLPVSTVNTVATHAYSFKPIPYFRAYTPHTYMTCTHLYPAQNRIFSTKKIVQPSIGIGIDIGSWGR